MSLPAGLIIVNSIARTLPDGNQSGCAILRNAGSTDWWSTDYFCGPGQNPMSESAVFGPHASEAGARSEMEGGNLVAMDAEGTPGSSTWLVYP
jgi:hypothetical protein